MNVARDPDQARKFSMALLYRRTVPSARSLACKSANHNYNEASSLGMTYVSSSSFFACFSAPLAVHHRMTLSVNNELINRKAGENADFQLLLPIFAVTMLITPTLPTT